MRKVRFLTIAGISAFWLMYGAASANAAYITYYADIFGGCTPDGNTCSGATATETPLTLAGATMVSQGGAPNTISLPGFNSALGTLTGVTVLLGETVDASLEITNNQTTTVRLANGTVDVPVTIQGTGLVSAGLSLDRCRLWGFRE